MEPIEAIKFGFKANRCTQKAAAKQLGISAGHLSKVLRGEKNPSVPVLFGLMAIAGVVCTVEKKERSSNA